MPTHCSILAWRTPVDRGVRRATVHEATDSDSAELLRQLSGGPGRFESTVWKWWLCQMPVCYFQNSIWNVIIWTGFSYREEKLEGMSNPPLRHMLSVSALGSMEKPTAQKRQSGNGQINRLAVSQEYLGTCLWAVSQESWALPDLVSEQ